MNCDWVQQRLDDYVDASVPLADREEIEAHLAGCDHCSADVAGMRALVARAAALPKSALPARDLLPAILASRDAPASSLPSLPRAAGKPRWQVTGWSAWMAVAAALLVIASSAMTWLAAGRHRPPAGGNWPTVAIDQRPFAELAALDAQYGPTAAELAEVLDIQRTKLAPRTVAIVEANLRIIDQAIHESREAILRDPGNRVLLEMLASTYRQKVDLLKRTTELARES